MIAADDVIAVQAAITEFGYLVDHGRAGECEKLFAETATITFGPGTPKPGTLDGIGAIRMFLSNRQAQSHVTTRHVTSNIRLTMKTGGEIAAYSLLTLYRSDDETRQPDVTFIADIDEVYARQDDGNWRVTARLITPVFSRTVA